MANDVLKEPEWAKRYNNGEGLACCWTCVNYKDGKCKVFNAAPPDEYKNQFDKCDSYDDGVPF